VPIITNINTEAKDNNGLIRIDTTTDITNFPSLEKLNPARKSSHLAQIEVQEHARALRRRNGKVNKIDHTKQCDSSTGQISLGARFMREM